jgi:hypothetical protein
MDIEGIVTKVRAALQQLADNPEYHCSDCGKEMGILPIKIEAGEPNSPGSSWKVTNWSYAETQGWIRTGPAVHNSLLKCYCPDCRRKHDL